MTSKYRTIDWLPTTKKEALLRGWNDIDVVLFSGDAYVDHPSFGAAVIGRLIESSGFKVAIVPQPNWQDDLRDFKKFGRPNLFFAATSGSMDSMVNHYTAGRRRRSDDAYSPGGRVGFRPDYALTVYSQIIKNIYPDVPLVIGGIEGSLRRFTHYDYWSDSLKPSILSLTQADLLIYGMGEKPILELLKLLSKNISFSSIKTLMQTGITVRDENIFRSKKWDDVELFSHEECVKDKQKFADNFKIIEETSNCMKPVRLMQKVGDMTVIINPPYMNLTGKDVDRGFDLPFTRLPHPKYLKKGGLPAYDMIRHSVTLHRGCFGGCSFCAISAHQGKFIMSRSRRSILKEIENLVEMEDFRGIISDLGGPSANMYMMTGIDREMCRECLRPSCIYPSICKNLNFDHGPLIDIYKEVARVSGVKKIAISSGVRYDMFFPLDREKALKYCCREYMEKLIGEHVSGRLKVAPEHISHSVLKLMRKPSYSLFKVFKEEFQRISKKKGLKQFIVPYFISSHPGSTLEDMAELALELKEGGFKLEQVQDFTPTPMTLSAMMYYTEINPYTDKKIYSAKTKEERADQNSFFFWYKRENQERLKRRLRKLGRPDIEKKLF